MPRAWSDAISPSDLDAHTDADVVPLHAFDDDDDVDDDDEDEEDDDDVDDDEPDDEPDYD